MHKLSEDLTEAATRLLQFAVATYSVPFRISPVKNSRPSGSSVRGEAIE
jgi:hypothetical protein